MAWDDTKVTDNPIAGSDWNGLVTAIKSAGSNYAAVNIFGSGNTYLKVDATNNKVEIYVNGTQVVEWS